MLIPEAYQPRILRGKLPMHSIDTLTYADFTPTHAESFRVSPRPVCDSPRVSTTHWRCLILRRVSRLYAFSGYLFLT